MSLCQQYRPTSNTFISEGIVQFSAEDALEYMKSLGPSAVDVEIRSLSPDLGGSVDVLGCFLKFAQTVLETKTNFEIIQAYLGLFLKVCMYRAAAYCVCVWGGSFL